MSTLEVKIKRKEAGTYKKRILYNYLPSKMKLAVSVVHQVMHVKTAVIQYNIPWSTLCDKLEANIDEVGTYYSYSIVGTLCNKI